jgi:hypothetical protein
MEFKTIKKTMMTFLVVILVSASTTFAKAEDRTTEKAREAVENASPHDWYTLATSAEKCFKKKVNLKQASDWLDQSLEIAETPFNLELKGDYFIDNRLPNRALEYYVRAMNSMKENDGQSDITKLQKKIAKIINIGG